MSENSAPAPKKPRRPKRMVGLTLPRGAQVLVDALVGSLLGNSRSEVLRFIVVSWITDHYAAIGQIMKKEKP
jgi:hypothetical protein